MGELCLVNGIGPKTELLLNKLNINNKEDLINYYPYRYEIIKRSDINDIENLDKLILDGIVESKPSVYYLPRKLKKISFRMNINNQLFNIIIYNQTYLLRELKIGMHITIFGKFNKVKNTIVCNRVRFEPLSDIPKIESVYHTTSLLSMKLLSKVIGNAIMGEKNIIDYIPIQYSSEYNFLSKDKAIKEIHNPSDINLLKQARLRLKYEELFVYMLKINYLKNKIQMDNKAIKREINYKKIDIFIKKLPFCLTTDQSRVLEEILQDMQDNKRMNRLLQGDVGSGKTIIAFISAYANYISGYQTAIMVPTEILANQHYESALKLFNGFDIKIGLLTSSTKAKEKKDIYKRLKEGDIDLIIGTQSLIQEDIIYNNLGLVITDEQHRFGVNQRNNLKNKGVTPDMLSMSATPIPRTYALTIYGDLDISSIKTKPVGRKEIITKAFCDKDIIGVLEMMNQQLKEGHQIYVIAPMIEENDLEFESISSLKEKMTKAFGKNYTIDIVHGKLDSKEKSRVMNDYATGKINILISTTVIEVGVDVKNASMIVIFNANNFGLSTIHQLRGRVGRSNIQSYCLLVSKEVTKRLNVLVKTNDGFEVSEYDFENRGEGDLFGIKQSGSTNFMLADIRKDYKMLLRAKEDSLKFMNNEDISNYPNIYKELMNINYLE